MEVQFLKNFNMLAGAFDHRFRTRPAIFLQHRFFQGSAVDADPDRNVMLLAGLDDSDDVFPGTDIAGIDANLIDAGFNRGQGQFIIEMDIGNQRDADLSLDFPDRPRVS